MTYSRIILGGDQCIQWTGGISPNFLHLYIISDTYYLITCKLNSVLWPSPKCNEDPLCRNPRGFRVPIIQTLSTKHLFGCNPSLPLGITPRKTTRFTRVFLSDRIRYANSISNRCLRAACLCILYS